MPAAYGDSFAMLNLCVLGMQIEDEVELLNRGICFWIQNLLESDFSMLFVLEADCVSGAEHWHAWLTWHESSPYDPWHPSE